MKILAINCGSSSLKFDVIDCAVESGHSSLGRRLMAGTIERIGGPEPARLIIASEPTSSETVEAADHGQAMEQVIQRLRAQGSASLDEIAGIGHRIVHGGERFTEPVSIDDSVIDAIAALGELAPLHNLAALQAIRAVRNTSGLGIPMIATFDTLFHRTLPERAARYAISPSLGAKHHIQRYGFHGLAHSFMAERYAAISSTPLDSVRIVSLQLGNGCSATAVAAGRSVDTSMGFTPLEGLMMGTRSGDIDPSLASYLSEKESVPIAEAVRWLNERSGLLGVSQRSNDMRELLRAEAEGHPHAALAIDMFCYRVRKQIGAYLAVLGGADAVTFGGGIGENAAQIRARICAGMDWCGLVLDPDLNQRAVKAEMRISAEQARMQAYVIPVDEALIIARDTMRCLYGKDQSPL